MVQPHRAVPAGGQKPRKWSPGLGPTAVPISPPFPGLNPLSLLPVSKIETILLHFLNSATVGKGGWGGYSQPPASPLRAVRLGGVSRCKAWEHEGWRLHGRKLVRSTLKEMKGPPRHLHTGKGAWKAILPSSPILLGWTQHHLQWPALLKGPDHFQDGDRVCQLPRGRKTPFKLDTSPRTGHVTGLRASPGGWPLSQHRRC